LGSGFCAVPCRELSGLSARCWICPGPASSSSATLALLTSPSMLLLSSTNASAHSSSITRYLAAHPVFSSPWRRMEGEALLSEAQPHRVVLQRAPVRLHGVLPNPNAPHAAHDPASTLRRLL
jgi:hypothetical protein